MRRGPRVSFRAAALLGAALLLAAGPARAFGKNKVNVHDFRWRVVSTEHFDIHFTAESEPLIPRAAFYLEKAYKTVTGDLDVPLKERIPFFFFVNHNQFEENNIVELGEGTGGVTEAFKNRFLVFNDGTEFWMAHVIPHEFTHVAQFEVLYGGFWKSARLLKSPLYPLWFMEGLSEYETGDLDVVTEDLYLRDAATSGRLYSLLQLHGFSHLRPHEVTLGYKQGGAAVRFLAEEYGPEKVAETLHLLRDRFEVPSIITDLTGQDFRAFDRRYREFLADYYALQSEGTREPETDGRRLTPDDLLPVFNTHPAFSPDGRFVAYLTDRNAAQEVALYDVKAGTHRSLAGRQWNRVENIHADGRAVSFSADGRWLAFVGEKTQRDYLYLYDVKRDRLRRVRTPFEQVRSPVFHPSEPRLALVGMKDGTNDLYEVTPRGKVLRRLTDSPADESAPAYSPDGKMMVYSAETAAAGPHGAPARDLAALNLATLSTAALTHLPWNETSPVFTPDGRAVVFVGEADGIPNLYRLDLPGGAVSRLTRVIGGNFSPDISRADNTIVFSSYRRGSQNLYLGDETLWSPSAPKEPIASSQPASANWAALAGGTPSPGSPAASPAPGREPAPPETAVGPFQTSTLFVGADRPYRFRASTDLFYPLFFYSSTDGLFLATYWQASEYLGNHQLQTAFQYSSGNDFLDYQAQYVYARFRPQFFLLAGGQNYFRDFAETEFRKETEQAVGVSYPLDRFNRTEAVAGSVFKEDRYEDFPEFNARERENFSAVSFVRDTTTGRYLATTAGRRFRATYQVARPVFGGDRDYRTQVFEYHNFSPTGGESALAFRGLGGVSVGDSPQLLRLGGVDRLRGFSRNDDENHSSRFLLTNLEWRVLLKYLDVRTGFIFPDFYFKAVYGAVFTDNGYAWDRSSDLNSLQAGRIKNSVGAGLRVPMFIMQTYVLNLSLDVAKRTDASSWVWYFSLGPVF